MALTYSILNQYIGDNMDSVECPICNNPNALQIMSIVDCCICKNVYREVKGKWEVI